MKSRCYNPKCPGYHRYGGRGIKVCQKWLNSLKNFVEWAIKAGWKPGLTIERKNVNSDYKPSNCEFIPRNRQSANRRNTLQLTAFGETKTLGEWCKDKRCNVTCHVLKKRINSGENHETAISTPAKISSHWILHAFNESKSLREWIKDSRCVVSREILSLRIKTGWNHELAIKTELHKSSRYVKQIEAFGEIKSIMYWSKDKRCKVGWRALYSRLAKGMSPEKAISS